MGTKIVRIALIAIGVTLVAAGAAQAALFKQERNAQGVSVSIRGGSAEVTYLKLRAPARCPHGEKSSIIWTEGAKGMEKLRIPVSSDGRFSRRTSANSVKKGLVARVHGNVISGRFFARFPNGDQAGYCSTGTRDNHWVKFRATRR